jgi:hypothetical protein
MSGDRVSPRRVFSSHTSESRDEQLTQVRQRAVGEADVFVLIAGFRDGLRAEEYRDAKSMVAS